MQSSVKALERQRQQLKADITAETDYLLAERTKELTQLENEAGERIKPLQEVAEQLQKQHDDLKHSYIDINVKLTAARDELQAAEMRTEDAKVAYELVKVDISTLEDRKSAVQAEIDMLVVSKQEVTDAIDTLHEEYTDHQLQYDQLLAAKQQLENDYKQTKDEQEQQLQVLISKQNAVLEETRTVEAEQKLVREDLAVRIRACDEREKNLKIREIKVAQGEDSIQRNASLLDL